jgi:hypothetical protein
VEGSLRIFPFKIDRLLDHVLFEFSPVFAAETFTGALPLLRGRRKLPLVANLELKGRIL